MALPVGVTTATVTAGVPVSHTGAPVKAFLSIEPSVFLVHTATGTPLVDFLEELSINEGVAGQFTLPHTDQTGFQDENGNAYTNWYYTARLSYSTPSKSKNKPPKIKVFQLATGQSVVDLDALPSGAPALPYTAPIATVTSVNGRTGPVTIMDGDLPERLSVDGLYDTIGVQSGSALTPLGSAVGRTPYTPRPAGTREVSAGVILIPAGALKVNGLLLRPYEQGTTRSGRYVNTGANPFVVTYYGSNRDHFFQPDVPYPVGNTVPPGSEWVETNENRVLWVLSELGTTIAYEVKIGA